MHTGNLASWAPSTDLTIYHVATEFASLLAAIAQHDHLEIDLADVQEVDSSGVQLLVIARRELELKGGEMRLSGARPEVLGLIRLLGLDETLGLEELPA